MNSRDGQVSSLCFRPRKGQAMRLNRDKRYQIKALLEAGILQKDIARMLKISPGGISKEISRNGGAKRYNPEKAEKRAQSRRGNPEFEKHLRHGNKKYRQQSPAKDGCGSIKDQRMVDDRMSNFCILEPLQTRDADDLAETMVAAFEPYKELLHTVTSDNGKEFAEHARIAKKLEVDYFFAHPYHSWERGANENMNGLIRQYLPKGTSFENLTRAEVKWVEWKLNNRPRKRLGYLTPLEYISRRVKQIYLAT